MKKMMKKPVKKMEGMESKKMMAKEKFMAMIMGKKKSKK